MKRKILIIGATSGIGRELAKLYSLKGYEVGIAGRRTDLLRILASELKTRSCARTLDIAQPETAMRVLNDLLAEMQDVELIIISAGIGHLNEPLDWEKEKDTIETNVLGFTAAANVAMKYFIERKTGHLVGISSIASIRGSDIAPSYNASKAFMSNYLEGLRIKVAKKHLPIIVTDIQPGLVDTAMAKGEGLFWVAPPEKAAHQIFHAVTARKKRAYVTKRWAIIAWIMKFLPDVIYQKL